MQQLQGQGTTMRLRRRRRAVTLQGHEVAPGPTRKDDAAAAEIKPGADGAFGGGAEADAE